MSEQDHLTTEEREAMTAMQADTAPVTEEEQAASASQEQEREQEPAEPTPEFKSTRSAPDWNSLTDEQREGVTRLLEGKPPQGMVPHQSMHSERMKRQELERRLAEIEAAQKTPAEVPQWVDPIEDADGHRKWEEHAIARARDEAIAKFREEGQQQAARMERINRAAEAEADFSAKQADYPAATDYLLKARVQQLAQMGLGEDEIRPQLQKEANAVYDAAIAAGLNPAAVLYMKAQEMGYKVAPATAPAQSDAERIAHLAETQQRTRGAGNAGGSAPQGELTMAQLADMSEAELMKLDPAVRRKAMGG